MYGTKKKKGKEKRSLVCVFIYVCIWIDHAKRNCTIVFHSKYTRWWRLNRACPSWSFSIGIYPYVRPEQQTRSIFRLKERQLVRTSTQGKREPKGSTRTQMSREAENQIVIDETILKIWQEITEKVKWSLEARTPCTRLIKIIVLNLVYMNMNMSLRKTYR